MRLQVIRHVAVQRMPALSVDVSVCVNTENVTVAVHKARQFEENCAKLSVISSQSDSIYLASAQHVLRTQKDGLVQAGERGVYFPSNCRGTRGLGLLQVRH